MAGMTDRDILAFEHMSTVAESTEVLNLFGEKRSNTIDVDIHDALMVAGLTPVIGNVADLADAAIYTIEGEYGAAALSAAAAIPIVGQIISSQKAIKKTGEEIITVYRGYEKWHPGKMVKEGRYVGGVSNEMKFMGEKGNMYTSSLPNNALQYTNVGKGPLLVFDIPVSYISKHARRGPVKGFDSEIVFPGGIPKEFLVKVFRAGKEATPQNKQKMFDDVWKFTEKKVIDKYPNVSSLGDMELLRLRDDVMKHVPNKHIDSMFWTKLRGGSTLK